MAHIEQQEFCLKVKESFPKFFTNVNVLDIGSLDINGNNRYLFEKYKYTGIDIGEGKNVDVVSLGHEYDTDERYDVVISTECFEHDMHYIKTILNAIKLTKSGGLFLFTCATTDRIEHGTSRANDWASPFSHIEFNDYYKNLTEKDIANEISMNDYFSFYRFEINNISHDLYFFGIKK